MEVSNHPGLMATQLWQFTRTPLRNSQGGLRGRMKEEENNTIKSCWGKYSWLPLVFFEKKVRFILNSVYKSVVFVPLSVLDHYHVSLTRFRMEFRNSEPGCDI